MCNIDALRYKSNGNLQNLEMGVADKMRNGSCFQTAYDVELEIGV